MCNIYGETLWTNFPCDTRYQPWPVGTRRFSPSRRTPRNRQRPKKARGMTRRQQQRLPSSTLALCVGYDLSVLATEFSEVNFLFIYFILRNTTRWKQLINCQPLGLYINWFELFLKTKRTTDSSFLHLNMFCFVCYYLSCMVTCISITPFSFFISQKARAWTRLLFSSLINLSVTCF